MKFNPVYLLLGALLFVGACKKAEAPAMTEPTAATTEAQPAPEAPAQTEAPAGQAQ